MLLHRTCTFLFTGSVRKCHKDVRVRFAPSPTGELHLGGLRTALYNYLFARKYGGKFIVRIEDTDQTRLVPGSADRIRDLLSHYGIVSDEDPWKGGPTGPYTQSERIPIYKEHAEQLVQEGHAYRCFCTAKVRPGGTVNWTGGYCMRLEMLRREAARSGGIPMYDRRCRSLSSEESRERARNGEEHVIRFVLDHQDVHFEDRVFGSVTQHLEESDPVLLKSDGFPTYHLANIVDDHQMKISDVIRGMEWLSSTGKHVLLYKAFSWRAPSFLHLPLITRDGKKKLSKRDVDAFVDHYDRGLGVLPVGVINFLVRNGSGIRDFDGDKLYSMPDLIEHFSVEDIGRRNFMMDAASLERLGAAAFRAASPQEVIPLIRDRLQRDLPECSVQIADDYLKRVVEFLREKEETFAFLSELTKGKYSFFFTTPASCAKLTSLFSHDMAKEVLVRVIKRSSWDLDHLKAVASSMGIKYPRLLSVLRVSLIDNNSGPPIGELRDFFGDEECTRRLQRMLEYLN